MLIIMVVAALRVINNFSPELTSLANFSPLAAMAIFGDKKSAVDWLSKPLRTLGAKRPRDVSIEHALTLLARIEHGFGA